MDFCRSRDPNPQRQSIAPGQPYVNGPVGGSQVDVGSAIHERGLTVPHFPGDGWQSRPDPTNKATLPLGCVRGHLTSLA